MLVKVGIRKFINPAHIVTLADEGHPLIPGNDWTIRTVLNTQFNISPAAAAYLMELMEVSQAVVLPGEPGYAEPGSPSTQPLTSRIAQALRYDFTQGADIRKLIGILGEHYHKITTALDTLIAEHVVIADDNLTYHHANNYTVRPKSFGLEQELRARYPHLTPNPDPLVEDEALASHPAVDSDSTTDPTS